MSAPAGADTERRVDALEARLALAASAAPPDVQLVRTTLSAASGGAALFKRVELRLPSGDQYVGETAGGRREGRGSYFFRNGDVYVGEFRANVFHGVGVLRKAPFSINGYSCVGREYQGEFRDGLRAGRGTQRSGFGDTYEGGFADDTYHGRGTMVFANGDRYEGDWDRGQRTGHGRVTFKSGAFYDGGWRQNEYHGEGVIQFSKRAGGGSYSGSWRAGLKHGIGKRVFSTSAEYEGEFVDDARTGRGVYKSPLGDLYVGTFLDNVFHGEGTLIKCDGDRYQGQFQRGVPCGAGRYEYEAGGARPREAGRRAARSTPHVPPSPPCAGYYEGEYLAMTRLGVDWRPMTKELNRRWFWAAWNAFPKTHIYDPIMGELLTVNGKRYVPGDPSACAAFLWATARDPHTFLPHAPPAVPEENKDPKKVPTLTRLAQLMREIEYRKKVQLDEQMLYESNLELITGGQREKAVARWKAKHDKQPVRAGARCAARMSRCARRSRPLAPPAPPPRRRTFARLSSSGRRRTRPTCARVVWRTAS